MTDLIPLRERNKLRTREELLDATAELLAGREGGAVTIEAIAQAAGVSRATVYAYFDGGRDEVIRAVYARVAERVRERGERLHAEATTTSDRITALGSAFIETVAKPSGRFYGVMRPDVAVVVHDLVGGTSSVFADMIRRDLEGARALGELSDVDDITSLAVALSGAIGGAGKAAALDPSRAESLANAIRAITRGVVEHRGFGGSSS